MMGRPTRDGKMCEGKLDPAYPHLTNLKQARPFKADLHEHQKLIWRTDR
jgi:hypothetical protein